MTTKHRKPTASPETAATEVKAAASHGNPKTVIDHASAEIEAAARLAEETVAASADSVRSGASLFPGMGMVPPVGLEELAGLGRDNLTALTRSNMALAQGLQAINQEILDYARKSFTRASQTAAALLAARTLDEVVQINGQAAKSGLETLFTRSAKLSEMGVSVASGTLAPWGDRVEATLSKMTKPLAA